jgi:hypothetical protein
MTAAIAGASTNVIGSTDRIPLLNFAGVFHGQMQFHRQPRQRNNPLAERRVHAVLFHGTTPEKTFVPAAHVNSCARTITSVVLGCNSLGPLASKSIDVIDLGNFGPVMKILLTRTLVPPDRNSSSANSAGLQQQMRREIRGK